MTRWWEDVETPERHNFEAMYPGKCAGCGDQIEPGDAVFYEEGALYAETCCSDMED